MLLAFRISFTALLTFVACLFTFNVVTELVPRETSGQGIWASISLVLAVLIGLLLWRVIGRFKEGLVVAMGGGAAIAGFVGLIGGFFGPMLFAPSANQGPLLGIFITGPLGFLMGGVSGAIWWRIRVQTPSR
jgi:hypothetical protein